MVTRTELTAMVDKIAKDLSKLETRVAKLEKPTPPLPREKKH